MSWPPRGKMGLHLSLHANMCFDGQAKVNAAAAL